MNELEQRLATLEQQVASLQSDNDIRALLSRYAISVDEKRPHLLSTLFTPDAVLEVPAWSIEVKGLEAVMQFFENYWGRFDNPRRYYANEDIRVDGDDAAAFMYWHVTQDLGEESVLGWGTYDWTFRRVDDQWLIKREVVHIRAMTTLAQGWGGQAEPMQL